MFPCCLKENVTWCGNSAWLHERPCASETQYFSHGTSNTTSFFIITKFSLIKDRLGKYVTILPTKDFLPKLCSILNCQWWVSALLENVWLKTKSVGGWESNRKNPVHKTNSHSAASRSGLSYNSFQDLIFFFFENFCPVFCCNWPRE